jgi:hypothetical protein
MKKNSVENYTSEKNSEEVSELIAAEQEASQENVLEELNSDFSEIEKDCAEIMDNPEASPAEKTQASIWRTRGKNLLYRGLALLSLSAPLQAAGQAEFSTDFNQPQNEISVTPSSQEKFKTELEGYKDFGPLMAYNLASEKPTAYQTAEIKKLEDGIIADLNGRKFASMTEMVAYINNAISSDFSEQASTIYIKDAFPEKPGAKAKGSFDCDSRLLITLSILDKIGITGDQAEFCLLEGHALLKIEGDNVFFEMTSNSARELDQDERLQLSKINSLDKYKAYLLAKEGTALASEATGSILSGERDDDQKIDLALNKMIAAAEIDPNNLTNNLNLLTLLKKTKYRATDDKSALNELVLKVSENVKRGLLNNYYKINPDGEMDNTLVLQAQEINIQKVEPRRLEDLGPLEALTTKALSENDYLSRKFIDLGSDLLYDFQNPKAALPIFKALASAENNNKEKRESADYCFYQGMVADCHFNLQEYDKYLDLSQKELYQLLSTNMKNDTEAGYYFKGKFNEENLKITAANVMAGKIIINEETVADFCKNYQDDPLFSGFISGKQQWHISAIDAVEALKAWPGFEGMIKVLDEYRKNEK